MDLKEAGSGVCFFFFFSFFFSFFLGTKVGMFIPTWMDRRTERKVELIEERVGWGAGLYTRWQGGIEEWIEEEGVFVSVWACMGLFFRGGFA